MAVDTKRSWLDAISHCQELGGNLISFSGPEEVNEVRAGLLWPQFQLVWIGINDRQDEGDWRWSDGMDPTWANWYGKTKRTDFNCAYIRLYDEPSSFIDASCSGFEFEYICKIEKSSK